MKTNLFASVAVAALVLTEGAAQSQEALSFDNPHVYVSVFAGSSLPNDIKVNYNSGAYSSSTSMHLKSGYLLGGAIGMEANDYLRGEIEYSRGRWEGKSYWAKVSGGVINSGDFPGTATANFLLANVWFDLKTQYPITPYVGGGLGIGWTDANLNDYAGDSYGKDFAFQLGAGAKYSFSEHVSLDAGYRFKSIPDVRIHDLAGDFPLTGGAYNSHNFQVGLTYRY